MPRAPLVLILIFCLTAPVLPAHAASVEPAAELGDTFRRMWERFRGRTAPAPEAATDAAALGRLVSWNVQTLGKSASKAKKDALRLGLAQTLGGSGPELLAAQEVANERGARTLARQLPDEGRGWTISFEDTSDAMNNAVFAGPGVTVNCSGNLDIEGVRHPPHMAHVTAGAIDFTVLSVHLSYAKGDAAASSAELRLIMAWVRANASRPGADPDVVVAGDFNLPTAQGKTFSVRAGDRSWEPLEDGVGPGFTALVDEPTSRRGRQAAANNYDHFLVSDDFLDEEFVSAGAADALQLASAEREAGGRASDHFPIILTFRASGADAAGRPLSLDGESLCR